MAIRPPLFAAAILFVLPARAQPVPQQPPQIVRAGIASGSEQMQDVALLKQVTALRAELAKAQTTTAQHPACQAVTRQPSPEASGRTGGRILRSIVTESAAASSSFASCSRRAARSTLTPPV